MKEKVVEELEDLGIEKNKIDNYMIWGAKKMMIGIMKMKMSMKESGMDKDETEKMMKKL